MFSLFVYIIWIIMPEYKPGGKKKKKNLLQHLIHVL